MSKMAENVKTALLVRAIWRMSGGNVSKFLPAGPVPNQIKHFLDSGPSIQDRRAALVAILDSIIGEEVAKP